MRTKSVFRRNKSRTLIINRLRKSMLTMLSMLMLTTPVFASENSVDPETLRSKINELRASLAEILATLDD